MGKLLFWYVHSFVHVLWDMSTMNLCCDSGFVNSGRFLILGPTWYKCDRFDARSDEETWQLASRKYAINMNEKDDGKDEVVNTIPPSSSKDARVEPTQAHQQEKKKAKDNTSTMEHLNETSNNSGIPSRNTQESAQRGNSSSRTLPAPNRSPQPSHRQSTSAQRKNNGVVWPDFEKEKPPVIDSAWESA